MAGVENLLNTVGVLIAECCVLQKTPSTKKCSSFNKNAESFLVQDV